MKTQTSAFRGYARLSLIATVAIFGAAVFLSPAAPEGGGKGKAGESGQKQMQVFEGTLQTGVMAIGAETTGVTLTTASGEVYELDLKNPKLKQSAESLNGKKVSVEGIYKPRPGVEVKERRIIDVKRLAAAG
jgi:hypothetical protein